ncbi:DUF3262 family protein [Avibacterium sp. 21-599]|uniref:DUF3262 family protein n=1 Tax=Avibacterium sp. 21-599 TaxID=2911528 RepID=UPI0022464D16|nr:DUF3262 family protein [Avibacterium sp. 21-599]MCW9718550.1 DUF3262 family protein [Avibacterium sp. 21-599]
MNNELIKAFDIGAGSSAGEVRILIVAIIFAAFFFVWAYILSSAYEGVKKGQLSLNKLGWMIGRIALVSLVMGYFLLH